MSEVLTASKTTVKQVQIRRKEPRSHLSPAILDTAMISLSAVYVNGSTLRGMSYEEESKYLPAVVGVSPTSPDFSSQCSTFWKELSLKIPSEGYVLDISTRDGEPINLLHMIYYKWAKAHPMVADTSEQMRAEESKRFYIYDPEREMAKESHKAKTSMKAYKEFIRLSEEADQMRSIIRMMSNNNPDTMNSDQLTVQVKHLVEASPDEFLKLAMDKDLSLRSELATMVSNNVVNKIGGQYLYMDVTVGETEEQAVNYLKNQKNSKVLVEMRAKLQEFTRER